MVLTISRCSDSFLTISKAQGKGRAEAFVRKIRTHLDNNNVDAAIKECDVQKGSVANVMRSTLIKYKEMETTTGLDLDQKIVSIQKELENRNLEILSSGFERIPQVTKELTPEQVADVEKLLEKIEEDDDVMNVYHTMQESAE